MATIQFKRGTAARWAELNLILEAGQPGFVTDENRLKIGDGTKTWAELSYFGDVSDNDHVFEVEPSEGQSHTEAIAVAVGESEIGIGDVAIVKELIHDGKYQYTAYVHNGTMWTAMDGNYNAENVYFDEDFTFTKAIGTVTIPSSGSKVVAAAGKNIKEFFAGLFAAEQNPTKTDPSVSVTLTGAGSYEVGTTVNPSYSASFEDGKYTYGPEPTGAAVSAWSVTSTNGESFTANTGTCAEIVVGDNTNYSVTAKATHSAGSFGKTNLGNDSTIQIAAGEKSKTSSAITGYRNSFYGSSTSPVELNSANIRALAGNTKSSTNSISVNIVDGAKQVIIAVPDGRKVTKVADEGAFGTDIFSEFVLNAVDIEGANGYTAKAYNVYVYSPAAALGANTYTVSIANE